MSAARSYRWQRFGSPASPGIEPLSLGVPAAAFPGRIATGSDLIVAVDRQQTTLLLAMAATDTTITVTNPAGIVAYNLLSIDNEIVKTTGPPAGNVVPVSRGFDGTTAAAHLSGATVSGLVDAFHHNGLVAEIEAIETFLGPNGQNIAYASIPFLVSSNFMFSPQSPGGSLIVGNNSVTLTPVPKGVNGTDTGHYLYISGGTGTPEPALITGGSAVSGATSGTVIVSCANTHSGAWTVQSATAGISEAVNALPSGGGLVYVPAGSWTLYGTTTVAGNGVTIVGSNAVGTTLNTSYTGGPIFYYPNAAQENRLADLYILGPNTGNNYGIQLIDQAYFKAENLKINNVANGISISGSTLSQQSVFRNLTIAGITGYGAYINTTIDGGTWENVVFGGSGSSSIGMYIKAVAGIRLAYVYTNNCIDGVRLAPATGDLVSIIEAWNLYLDGTFTPAYPGVGFHMAPAGGSITSLTFYGGGAFGFGWGIYCEGTGSIQDIVLDGFAAEGNGHDGFHFDGSTGITIKDITFQNCSCQSNSAVSSAANNGMYIRSASNILVYGGIYAVGSSMNGANTQSAGIAIVNSTDVLINGPVVMPNVNQAFTFIPPLTRLRIFNSIGYNPVGQSTISVGASPFAYTAGYSPETVYISGGTVSSIKVGATQVASASPATVVLAPNAVLTVTYSAAPTMVKDVQ